MEAFGLVFAALAMIIGVIISAICGEIQSKGFSKWTCIDVLELVNSIYFFIYFVYCVFT